MCIRDSHCPLMAPAAEEMKEALEKVEIQNPIVKLVPNVSLEPTQDAQIIKKLLVEQVTGRVRWRETIEFFGAQKIDTFLEIGAGSVLTGMSKRTAPDAKHFALSSVEEFKKYQETI